MTNSTTAKTKAKIARKGDRRYDKMTDQQLSGQIAREILARLPWLQAKADRGTDYEKIEDDLYLIVGLSGAR